MDCFIAFKETQHLPCIHTKVICFSHETNEVNHPSIFVRYLGISSCERYLALVLLFYGHDKELWWNKNLKRIVFFDFISKYMITLHENKHSVYRIFLSVLCHPFKLFPYIRLVLLMSFSNRRRQLFGGFPLLKFQPQRFPNPASYMWVEFVVGSRPCFEGFSQGSPVFLPPQKPTFLNSNSIGNSRATGLSVEDCCVSPSLNKVDLFSYFI